MKVEEFEFPEDLYYLKNHVWLKESDGVIQVGITSLGQSLAREIVHIDLLRWEILSGMAISLLPMRR